MFRLVSLIAGILFGMGMSVSGMVDPVNVIGFLDVAGSWSPDLAFVMGGALAVFMPAYFLLIKPRKKPVVAQEFCLATNRKIDFRLLFGAATFGIGWGLAGMCPGPAIASLGSGNGQVVLFFAFMMVGLGATHLMLKSFSQKPVEVQPVSSGN